MDQILSFPYTGVIFNALVVIIGSLIGLACKKSISTKLTEAVMHGIGLCVAYIGISGALNAGADANANPVTPVIAMALGAVIGTLIDIDRHLNLLGNWVERKFSTPSSDGSPAHGKIAEGFVSASLLFCVGAMTIMGGLAAGISGDNTIYFTKGVIDMVSAVAFTVSFGIGVALSSVCVLLLQGSIVLTAGFIEPLLTTHMIAEMNCVGNLLIVFIGLNLMGITKVKVANYLPAILVALLLAIII